MVKKRNNIAVIFIIVAGVLILSSAMFYASSVTKKLDHNFASNKRNLAETTYARINDIDFEHQYPSSPEAVIDVYCDTVLLLYGNMIINDDIYGEIIDKQRQLYADELIEKNSFNSQYKNILGSIQQLSEYQAVTTKIQRAESEYLENEKDEEICMVGVVQHISGTGVVYWDYELIKVDDQWKINTWTMIENSPE